MIVVTIDRKDEAAEARYNSKTLYSQTFEDDALDLADTIIFLNSQAERKQILTPTGNTNE